MSRAAGAEARRFEREAQQAYAAQQQMEVDRLNRDLDQRIRRLEREMLEAAKNLEFERAASLRDELKAARDRMMVVGGEG